MPGNFHVPFTKMACWRSFFLWLLSKVTDYNWASEIKGLDSVTTVLLLSGVYFDDLYFLLEKKSKSGNSYQADSIYRLCDAWVKWD